MINGFPIDLCQDDLICYTQTINRITITKLRDNLNEIYETQHNQSINFLSMEYPSLMNL